MGRPTVNRVHAGPFLKWAGGKTQLLPELMKRVPEKFGTYYEPFVGAGALFFELVAQGRIRKARLSDVNAELIHGWTMLRDDVEAVIAALEALERQRSEDDFYRIRGWDPATLEPALRTARLVYLNKTGFNGLYRVNSKGKFNVPWGKNPSKAVLDPTNLRLVSKALQGVEIEVAPFDEVGRRVRKGDFVYFDPPYDPVKKKEKPGSNPSFTSYAKSEFGQREQEKLAEIFGSLAARGVHVLLSNSETELTRRLYDAPGHRFELVQAARFINRDAGGRGKINEILVSAGPGVPKAALAG